MAKPPKQESQDSNQPPEDFSTAHPLMRHTSQSQELLERVLKRKDAGDFRIKELQQWKDCVNAVAATANGQLLLKSMLEYSGIMLPPDIANANKMVTNTLKGSFYLTWIRPYLDVETRREIE